MKRIQNNIVKHTSTFICRLNQHRYYSTQSNSAIINEIRYKVSKKQFSCEDCKCDKAMKLNRPLTIEECEDICKKLDIVNVTNSIKVQNNAKYDSSIYKIKSNKNDVIIISQHGIIFRHNYHDRALYYHLCAIGFASVIALAMYHDETIKSFIHRRKIKQKQNKDKDYDIDHINNNQVNKVNKLKYKNHNNLHSSKQKHVTHYSQVNNKNNKENNNKPINKNQNNNNQDNVQPEKINKDIYVCPYST